MGRRIGAEVQTQRRLSENGAVVMYEKKVEAHVCKARGKFDLYRVEEDPKSGDVGLQGWKPGMEFRAGENTVLSKVTNCAQGYCIIKVRIKNIR